MSSVVNDEAVTVTQETPVQPAQPASEQLTAIPLPEEYANPTPLPEDKKIIPEDRLKARESIKAMLQESYLEGRKIDSNNSAIPSPHFDVKIYDTHVEMQIGGVSKNVSITFFAELMQSLLNVETTPKVNYELPFGTYLMGVTGDHMEISCYYPETIDTIKFLQSGEQHKFTLPIPNTIIYHSLKKIKEFWVVQETRYYATSKRVNQLPNEHIKNLGRGSRPTDGVYTFPFGNMHDGGAMCYGENQIPTQHGSNLRGLDYFYRLLTIAPFNRDLSLKFWGDSHYSFYEMLSKKKEFPYEIFR